jgi:SAM-dependent methyltransferase
MGNLFRRTKEYFDVKHRIDPLSDTQSAIEGWFETGFGRYLLQQERLSLAQLMPSSGAHRMIHLGVTSERVFTDDFNHIHSFSLGASIDNVGDSAAIADYDALPLPTETIDTVLLHHALEFSVSPHAVLTEASRILKPCGHMVLMVLNPISFFGVAKWPGRLFSAKKIWRYHSLRQGRIMDWLRLLNLEPIKVASGCFSWPAGSSECDVRTRWMDKVGKKYHFPYGAYYIVVARKYVARPTLMEPSKWKSIAISTAPAVKKGIVDARGKYTGSDVSQKSKTKETKSCHSPDGVK